MILYLKTLVFKNLKIKIFKLWEENLFWMIRNIYVIKQNNVKRLAQDIQSVNIIEKNRQNGVLFLIIEEKKKKEDPS